MHISANVLLSGAERRKRINIMAAARTDFIDEPSEVLVNS